GFKKPVTRLKNVLLPEPFGPLTPTISPLRTSMRWFFRATRRRNDLVRSRVTRMRAGPGETPAGVMPSPLPNCTPARRTNDGTAVCPRHRWADELDNLKWRCSSFAGRGRARDAPGALY